MIEISNISKSLGENLILKNIDLKIEKGSIFGLIGPNGTGKTTLIKCLTGIYKEDEGSILIDGEKVYENPIVKRRIAYLPDQSIRLEFSRFKDLVKFYELAYPDFSIERLNEINKLFKIDLNQKLRSMSKGMLMRTSIMLTIAIMPDILVLDEPLAGLDPIAKRQMINILLHEAVERNTTIIISSHNLDDIERICDTVGVMENGEIVFNDSIENMKKKIRKLQFVPKSEIDISKFDGIMRCEKIGRVYNVVTTEYEKFIEEINKKEIMFLEELDLSLEDIFVYYLGGDEDEKIL
ncbi:ABC transporter ATP-binding protein [Clostridium sp. DL1XJH146]